MAETRWDSLRAIIARLSTAASRDDFVEECLTTIVEALHADRALAFLTDAAGATVTLEARGPGRRLSPAEQTEISRGVVPLSPCWFVVAIAPIAAPGLAVAAPPRVEIGPPAEGFEGWATTRSPAAWRRSAS